MPGFFSWQADFATFRGLASATGISPELLAPPLKIKARIYG